MSDEIKQRRSRFTPRKNTLTPSSQSSMRLSIVLLGVLIALALGVASWLGFLSPNLKATLGMQEISIVETGEVGLTGARYRGVSLSGRPYEITAEEANEAQDGSGLVHMVLPTAMITLRDGAEVNLRSNNGVFNRGSHLVDLAGNVVVIQSDSRLRLDTEALQANLKSGEMHSDVPVELKDSDRQVNANSMLVYNNGERIVFGGSAKMTIRSRTSDKPLNVEIKS